MPRASVTATMMTFAFRSKSTLERVRIPVAATVPKSAKPAPPSTGRGIAATTAASLGKSPSRIRNTPAAATTQRLLTPVRRTSPTFWAYAVYGKAFKTPPSAVESPSARSPGQVVLADRLPNDLTHRDGVARGLDHGHKHDQDHGEYRRELEGRHTEEERRGDAERGRLTDPAEVCYPDDGSDDGAENQAEEHRYPACKPAEEPVDDQDDEQHREGEGDVTRAAEAPGARVAAASPVDRDRQEGDTDHGDDRAGHDRRKEAQETREVRADEEGDDPGDDHRAVDRGQPPGLPDQDHRRHRREGHTLDDGEPEPYLPVAYSLDQGGHPARKEVGVYEVDELLLREPYGVREDERHRDGPSVHRQHVLEPENHQPPQRQNLVHWMDTAGAHTFSRSTHFPTSL